MTRPDSDSEPVPPTDPPPPTEVNQEARDTSGPVAQIGAAYGPVNINQNAPQPPPSEPPPQMWWGYDSSRRALFFNVKNLGSADVFAIDMLAFGYQYRAYWHDNKSMTERTLRNGESDWTRIAHLDPNGWMAYSAFEIMKDHFEKLRRQNLVELYFTPLALEQEPLTRERRVGQRLQG